MRKSTWKKVCKIMDSPHITNEAKKDRILNIFAQQRYIDIPLLRGCLREIGYDPTIALVTWAGGEEGTPLPLRSKAESHTKTRSLVVAHQGPRKERARMARTRKSVNGEMKSILWCTSHYTTEACRKYAKELRESGKWAAVRLVDKLNEDGRTYHRIRLYWTGEFPGL